MWSSLNENTESIRNFICFKGGRLGFTNSVREHQKARAFQKVSCARHRWLKPTILATWEAEAGRITILSQPGQIVHETPISKITRAKLTGGVAQEVEWQLCKHKALSSNPSPTKAKKNKTNDTLPLSYAITVHTFWSKYTLALLHRLSHLMLKILWRGMVRIIFYRGRKKPEKTIIW
jgi:hypothetical protein